MNFDPKKTSAVRVEQGERYTLLLGDSQRILREIPPDVFDALVCDPPYSSGGFVRSDRMKDTGVKYSSVADDVEEETGPKNLLLSNFDGDNRDQRSFLTWAQLWLWDSRSTIKKGGIGFIFTDWRQLPIMTDAYQLGGWIWRGLFVWDKGNAHRRAGFGRFSSRSEFGIWGSNGPMTYTIDPIEAKRLGLDPEMLNGAYGCQPPANASRRHVTEKPASLMYYIARAVPRDGIILDPFCGVGSTGMGAFQAGRRFVGIELDPKAFDYAARRFERMEKTKEKGDADRE